MHLKDIHYVELEEGVSLATDRSIVHNELVHGILRRKQLEGTTKIVVLDGKRMFLGIILILLRNPKYIARGKGEIHRILLHVRQAGQQIDLALKHLQVINTEIRHVLTTKIMTRTSGKSKESIRNQGVELRTEVIQALVACVLQDLLNFQEHLRIEKEDKDMPYNPW